MGEDDAPASAQEYEERYVAFIDILGFKELIRASTKDATGPASLGSIFNALYLDFSGLKNDYARYLGSEGDGDLRINTFSDFVVISTIATEQGLDMLCFVVWCVARDWLSKGYLSRGGISKGLVIHIGGRENRPGMVFGPAFIEAYQLEQDVADHPRVVLSKAVRHDVSSMKRNGERTIHAIKRLVRPCDDGPQCLDLFSHLRQDGFSFLGTEHRPEAEQFARTLTAQLDHGGDVPRWHRKTRWVVEQFNQAVQGTRYADLTIRSEA